MYDFILRLCEPYPPLTENAILSSIFFFFSKICQKNYIFSYEKKTLLAYPSSNTFFLNIFHELFIIMTFVNPLVFSSSSAVFCFCLLKIINFRNYIVTLHKCYIQGCAKCFLRKNRETNFYLCYFYSTST